MMSSITSLQQEQSDVNGLYSASFGRLRAEILVCDAAELTEGVICPVFHAFDPLRRPALAYLDSRVDDNHIRGEHQDG